MISIHHCRFLSDSQRVETDEEETIRGETAKHGRRKKPGREEDTSLVQSWDMILLKGHDEDGGGEMSAL